jgi:hypothetical protein
MMMVKVKVLKGEAETNLVWPLRGGSYDDDTDYATALID